MILIPIPDKWVRKAVYDAITAVDPTIPIFDSRTTAQRPSQYVLLSTQNSIVEPITKCGERWNHSLQIDCYDRIPAPSNPGSRVGGDDLLEIVRGALENLSLDPASNLNLLRWQISLPFDSVSYDENFVNVQKVLRLECIIN